MKLIGMMPARNEDWCLGLSLRVALMWCDEVVVLLHACTDRSAEITLGIARECPGRVRVIATDGEWAEMEHRQRMLVLARSFGATHLAIIDADEILCGNLLPSMTALNTINAYLYAMRPGEILQLPGYNLRNGIDRYHSNGVWGKRWFSTAFADDPRLHWGGNTFHAREPRGLELKPYRPIQQGQGGVMHLWGCFERRLIAKHAMYKVTERLRWPEKSVERIEREYSWAINGDPIVPSFGTPDSWTYAPVPESWWAPYAHLMKYLEVDQEPWQEAEVPRLVAEHGNEKFAGLDLFGVA
jgi:hypothetical protein